MKKKIINVPAGIRYISDWQGFKLPDFKHIIDKKIPGCGFTEYCIRNDDDVVLCSPRKVLLQNKADQHPEVLLIKTDYDIELPFDKNLLKKSKVNLHPVIKKPDYPSTYKKIKYQIEHYIAIRTIDFVRLPFKILVTYDSFGIVKKILGDLGLFKDFQVIVDEFTAIFTDSKFKGTTEFKFLNYLNNVKRVCFVSATPMMEKYLDQISQFKDLPYYELDWEAEDPRRVKSPKFYISTINNILAKGTEIIQSYLSESFEKFYYKDDQRKLCCKESKEAVIYVNSVTNACSLIKKSKLSPDQVNILVANTSENVKRIHRSLGKTFNIGTIPLKGQPHKMFTFCTRTVYLGADFYSDNARTFVLSDANIQTLAVDIYLDLPQILGRQRLEENPWKNEVNFYYISLSKNRSDYTEMIDHKKDITNSLINSYNNSANSKDASALVETYNINLQAFSYKYNYISLNQDPLDATLHPVYNKLVEIAEQRAFDMKLCDYQNDITVFNSVTNSLNSKEDNKKLYKEIMNFLGEQKQLGNDVSKILKHYCESNLSDLAKTAIYNEFPAKIKSYLSIDQEKLKALEYRPGEIEKYLENSLIDISREILSKYGPGDRLEKSQVKKDLQDLYDKAGIKKVAKASDLGKWFKLGRCKIKGIDGIKIIAVLP